MVLEKLDIHMQEKEIPYTKINVMRIKDFNIRPMWTHKTIEENTEKIIFDIGLGYIYIYIYILIWH